MKRGFALATVAKSQLPAAPAQRQPQALVQAPGLGACPHVSSQAVALWVLAVVCSFLIEIIKTVLWLSTQRRFCGLSSTQPTAGATAGSPLPMLGPPGARP